MHVSAVDFVLVATIILAGSIVQGSIGFGLNLLGAPFVAIVVPEAVPATMVLIAAPLAVSTFLRDRHAVDRLALPWMVAGALPGTLIGALIVSEIDVDALAVLIGSVTLVGVALSVLSPPVPINRATSLAAGFTSNIFGTASSVGGPPVALLFQHRAGAIARATLSGFFSVSAAMSIIAYVITGVIEGDHLWLALGLVPFMAAGYWASRHFHAFVDGGWLRAAVLILSAIAGASAIVHGLT